MPQQSTPTQGMDFHFLNSTLLQFGVSPGGAHQFIQGLPIASQEDRNALRAMLLGMTKALPFQTPSPPPPPPPPPPPRGLHQSSPHPQDIKFAF